MTASALRRIEASLRELVERADADHPIDPDDVWLAAERIAAQVEMIEKGLIE